MPYISKAEIERRRWVDLAAAIDHVKAVDGCGGQQALQSIKAAIQDGKIPYRWEDQARPPRFSAGPLGWTPPVSDMLPDEWEVDAQMRLKDTTGRFRVLLLLKFALEALFEQAPKPEEEVALQQAPELAINKPKSEEEIALRQAPDLAINKAIEEVYNSAESAGCKPPNIKELPTLVLRLLEKDGYVTSKERIMKLGGSPEFKRRRWKVGRTLKNEKRSRA
jgi:hypothetical protein